MCRAKSVSIMALLVGWLGYGGVPSADAQVEPGTFNLPIVVYRCEADPGSVGVAMGDDPAACYRVSGVAVRVANSVGHEIATCVTQATGSCIATVPYDADLVVTEDTRTVPTGYVPRDNPIRTRASTEIAAVIFVNLPLADTALSAGKPRSHQTTAQLVIHYRKCPLEFLGTDFYTWCHDNPIVGASFVVKGAVSREVQTNVDGDATFVALPPDTYEIVGGAPGDFVRTKLFCASSSALGTPFPGRSGGQIELAAGDHVICDWFNVPEPRRAGPRPTPDSAWFLPTPVP